MATRRAIKRLWLLGLLLGLALCAYALGLHRQLSLQNLVDQQAALRVFVAAHEVAMPAAFMLSYAAMVACAIPGGVVFSIAAGLLFGMLAGTAIVLVAVTAGSCVLVVAARSALRPMVERHAGARLGRLVAALQRDGFSYLLAARLLPFAPFWLTNLAAALTRIGLAPFALATVIGLAPITLVLTAAGAGLAETLASGEQPSLAGLLRPIVVAPLLLSAMLSLAPIALRHWRVKAGRVKAGRNQAGRKSGTDR